jgi:hypothetical protein
MVATVSLEVLSETNTSSPFIRSTKGVRVPASALPIPLTPRFASPTAFFLPFLQPYQSLRASISGG